MPVGEGGRLGPVRAVRLAQDAADVVGRRVLADRELLADLTVAEPAGDELQDLRPRAAESPSGSPAPRPATPSAPTLADSPAMPIRSASAAASPSSASARPRRRRAAAEQQARVLVGGVGQPGGRAHLPVQRQRAARSAARRGPARPASRRACPGSGRRRRSRRPGARSSRWSRRAARAPDRRAPRSPRRRARRRRRSGR